MADIAKEAGITRPAVYNYFSDREELVVEVMVRHINARAAALHREVSLDGPAAPLIVAALETGIVGDDDDGAVSALMLDDEVVHDTGRLVAQSPRVFDAMSEYWRPYLEYARERGELRSGVDLEQAVRWLTFIVFHFLTVPETVPPHEELPTYLRTFVVAALVQD